MLSTGTFVISDISFAISSVVTILVVFTTLDAVLDKISIALSGNTLSCISFSQSSTVLTRAGYDISIFCFSSILSATSFNIRIVSSLDASSILTV